MNMKIKKQNLILLKQLQNIITIIKENIIEGSSLEFSREVKEVCDENNITGYKQFVASPTKNIILKISYHETIK